CCETVGVCVAKGSFDLFLNHSGGASSGNSLINHSCWLGSDPGGKVYSVREASRNRGAVFSHWEISSALSAGRAYSCLGMMGFCHANWMIGICLLVELKELKLFFKYAKRCSGSAA